MYRLQKSGKTKRTLICGMSSEEELKHLSSNLLAQYCGEELITSLVDHLGLFSILRHHYESIKKKKLSTVLEKNNKFKK